MSPPHSTVGQSDFGTMHGTQLCSAKALSLGGCDAAESLSSRGRALAPMAPGSILTCVLTHPKVATCPSPSGQRHAQPLPLLPHLATPVSPPHLHHGPAPPTGGANPLVQVCRLAASNLLDYIVIETA